MDLLASQVTAPRFARHQFFEDVVPGTQAEAISAFNDPATLAIDLAHGIAFRTGLGASLFASSASPISVTDVEEYASKVFSSGNIAVVGTGVEESTLKALVDEHLAGASTGSASSSAPSKYYGGETRIAPQPDAHGHGKHTVFIGFGSSSPSADLAILSAYLDPTPQLKWAQSSSPIASLLTSGTTVQSVYLPYSDAALAGVVIQSASPADAKAAAQVVAKAIKEVKAGSLQGDAFKIAHAKAKFAAASALETRDVQVGNVGSKVSLCYPKDRLFTEFYDP